MGALVIAIVLVVIFFILNLLFHPHYSNPSATLLAFFVPIHVGVFSMFSACYLTGPSFREFARQFVEERQKQKAGTAKSV